MSSSFIPGLHFVSADQKLTPKWAGDAISYYWHNTNNRSLLEGKNVSEIDLFTSGRFSLDPFKRLFKSQQKELLKQSNPNYQNSTSSMGDLDWQRVSQIIDKYNSATSLIQKIPVEVTVKAIDALATEKKQKDLSFLKNKPQLEQDLQPIADKLQLGKVDLGTTSHSAVPFSDNPYGLDLNEPDELNVFVNLLYALKEEAAFETILDTFWKLKNCNQVKLLLIRDQFKYGVSCLKAYQSNITGLPDVEREYPGNVFCPYSDLPDYSDNTCRFIYENPTVIELFNKFGDEICANGQDKDTTLEKIINGTDKGNPGYCFANDRGRVDKNGWDTFRVHLLYCEVKSVDGVGITGNPKSKRGFEYITTDPEEVKACKNQIWAQNTYAFYWLKNTKHFFGIHKLGSAVRKKGLETYSGFSSIISKTQDTSAVELSIGENKIAQEAYIKMQHAIRKSLPAGSVVDLRFIRNALSGLKEENNQYTMEQLITLAFEENKIVIDTEGFEGKNDGQFKPFVPIAGGLNINEIAGYAQVIEQCDRNIKRYFGTNDQVLGQGYQELVGNNKLAQNASMNSISYVSDSIQFQTQNLYNIWSYQIKDAVEAGGESKKAIQSIVGSEKANLIDAIEDFPSHQMSVEVKVTGREEERLKLEQSIFVLKQNRVLSEADEYMLSAVQNPKDKWALIAVKEKLFNKKQDKIRQEQFAQQQQMIQQQGQNQVAAQQAETEGDIKKEYAKGQVQTGLLQLQNQTGASLLQMEGMIKKMLQDDRGQQQTGKSIATLREKANLDQQKAFQTP